MNRSGKSRPDGGGRGRGERADTGDGRRRQGGEGGRPGAETADAGRGAGAAGEAVAAARRVLRGDKVRQSDADRSKGNDGLWAAAAKWQAAADARRARGRGSGGGPGPGGGEKFKPWFTESSDEELWLNAEGTSDPWFWPDER
ncbi:MAG TPA: hypothetical protein VGH27_03760 [Streptosporangiaceae bacterium]